MCSVLPSALLETLEEENNAVHIVFHFFFSFSKKEGMSGVCTDTDPMGDWPVTSMPHSSREHQILVWFEGKTYPQRLLCLNNSPQSLWCCFGNLGKLPYSGISLGMFLGWALRIESPNPLLIQSLTTTDLEWPTFPESSHQAFSVMREALPVPPSTCEADYLLKLLGNHDEKYEIQIYIGSSLETLPGRTPLSNITDDLYKN